MAAPEVNTFIDGKWYGPSYPDAGSPPGSKADDKPSGSRPASSRDEGDDSDGSTKPKPASRPTR